MKYKAYIGDAIFTGETWLHHYAIIVKDSVIEALVPATEVSGIDDVQQYPGAFIAPAFIDIQIYGAHGKLLAVYPQPESLQLLYDYCRQGGASLCVPTVATNSIEVFKQCIDAVKDYWQAGGKGIYGLHLEGPWINKVKKGAHIEAFIHAPSMEEVNDLLQYGKDVIKIITLAPEVCSDAVIRMIQQRGIVVSAGHTDATYTQAMEAFDKGITTATHLYNAMSALQHRAPGMVGALFSHPTARCSIIPDGHHVDYAALLIAKRLMGNRLFVITDAVTETGVGAYQHHLDGDKYTSNGILSGSALTMHKAFLNLVNKAGIPVEEALRMCSLYPAQVIGKEGVYGKIAPQGAAQFIVLNKALELADVISA